MRAAALALLLLGGPAAAADDLPLPGLYDVTGVAAGEVLNLREAPDAGAAVVGSLAADARGIEVVARDASGRWGQVNTGERAAWAALRYLAAEPDGWKSGALPPGLSCYGTEPFWSLRPDGRVAAFTTPEGGKDALDLAAVLDIGLDGDPRRALIATGPDRRLTATILPAPCTDGMSDRAYGLDVTIVVEGSGEPRMLTGCCSLAR
jgi:uncharacterized membrane protein